MLLQVGSIGEARQVLADNRIDLVVVEPEQPDGSGLDLAGALATDSRDIRTIVVTRRASLDQAVQAIRAGAIDYIAKPLDLEQVSLCIRSALREQGRDRKLRRRVKRLRRVCTKLSAAREEVAQQVDLLCADLVSAYQELALQMHSVVHTSEFAAVANHELDLEQLLRKSLEYLLEKAGPTNAAIFLPATIDEFSLGGYVNYDWAHGAPDILLQNLADIVAPKLAEHDGVVHLTDPAAMREWVGEDNEFLESCHMVGAVCCHEEEPLAVIILFRDGKSPYDRKVIETCQAISPMLGEYLTKIIRIHHRHLPDDPFEADDDGEADEGDEFGLGLDL